MSKMTPLETITLDRDGWKKLAAELEVELNKRVVDNELQLQVMAERDELLETNARQCSRVMELQAELAKERHEHEITITCAHGIDAAHRQAVARLAELEGVNNTGRDAKSRWRDKRLDEARGHIAELEAERDRWRGLVIELIDDDDCLYDHHGYCQTHALYKNPCPYERAKALTEGENE
jgi:hypothetical protein